MAYLFWFVGVIIRRGHRCGRVLVEAEALIDRILYVIDEVVRLMCICVVVCRYKRRIADCRLGIDSM
jgi:hypothetical protein